MEVTRVKRSAVLAVLHFSLPLVLTMIPATQR